MKRYWVRILRILVGFSIPSFLPCCSALLKLLHESVSSGGGCKFTELVMKCNWKAIRILPSRTNDLDLDQILLDVHNFLVVSSVALPVHHRFTSHYMKSCLPLPFEFHFCHFYLPLGLNTLLSSNLILSVSTKVYVHPLK